MVGELTTRVTVETAVAVAGLALLAGGVAGAAAAAGVLAGGLITILNFRWLARGASRLTPTFPGRGPGTAWLVGVGLRFTALFGAIATLLASGLVHPLGLMGGLAVLPGFLIAQGLRMAAAVDAGDAR